MIGLIIRYKFKELYFRLFVTMVEVDNLDVNLVVIYSSWTVFSGYYDYRMPQ